MATFLGKFAFGSTDTNQAQKFLTAFRLQRDWYAGMAGSAASDPAAACNLYDAGTGIIVQLVTPKGLRYLTVGSVGWIEFTDDLSQAAMFQGPGQLATWTSTFQGQPATVGYVLDQPPLVTVNENPYTTFASTQITPPLSAILASKKGAGMDFSAVDLTGQDLSGVDFSGASFAGAVLTNTSFKTCPLNGANFDGATLVNTAFDGATLDSATFREAHTDVSQVLWKTPKSALGIDFSRCQAEGTKLGGTLVDFTGANLSGANFSGADLSYLNLSRCTAAQAILAEGCNCSHATFDDATLTGLVAPRGIFISASLKRAKGGGAVFVGADLSQADLTEAQFGAKSFLFAISETLASDLDSNAYASPAVIAAFGTNGVTLSRAAITVLAPGAAWRIVDPSAGRFSVNNSANAAVLDVFRTGGAVPAAFTNATMIDTVASSAGFASADFTGARWKGPNAKGDHADLETAVLAEALLAETDFTQATISGTSFVGSVLIAAKFNGCIVSAGGDGQPTSFARAQLQGAQFADAKLDDVLLAGAAISLPEGVPLFVMPSSYQAELNSDGLSAVAQYFAKQGYALAADATIELEPAWRIDNSSDQTPNAVTSFAVRGTNLGVFNGATDQLLFHLSPAVRPALAQPTATPALINAFAASGYDLAVTATISSADFWQITNPSDGPAPAAYQFMRIHARGDGLHVYGALTVVLAAWPQLGAVAFGPTLGIQAAANPASLCPNGYPRAAFDRGLFTWEQMMAVGPPSS